MKRQNWIYCECGDCQHNLGHDGHTDCHCELTGAHIYPDDQACSKFEYFCDLEEELED